MCVCVCLCISSLVLVDPGKLTFNLDQSKKEHASAAIAKGSVAEGVVMVTVTGRPPVQGTKKKEVSPGRCVTLRLSNKKYKCSLETGKWQAKYAFLVYNLEQEVVGVAVGVASWDHKLMWPNEKQQMCHVTVLCLL